VARIMLSTGGGDAPGLNAVIYGAVHTAESLGIESYGVIEGYDGILFPDQYPDAGVLKLDSQKVHGIAPLGGTILGTTNRGNPFRHNETLSDGSTVTVDRSPDLVDALHRLGIDALIAVGGDGSLSIAHQLNEKGLRVIGVPKTIDNDLEATDFTFGFQSAVSFATECIERLHSTAEAHRRILCVEVMGRHAGWIALHAGVASMADAVLIPEIPFDIGHLAARLRQKLEQGQRYAIVVVAEGAAPAAGKTVVKSRPVGGVERLGGIGERVAEQLQDALNVETRAVTLGHLLRGGSPIAFDRILGLALGAAAVQAFAEGLNGVMVALKGMRITYVPLSEAIVRTKQVPIDGMGIRVARALGISLGDEGAQSSVAA
jgi:ATP-dependent phosphofructokinase / diphosphate-dependent phosphofructokinase